MKYIAFLRGVNVGGVKIKMADLAADFKQHGFTEVQTILATGNVIFKSEQCPDLSFLPVKVFVVKEADICRIVEANPFYPATAHLQVYTFICAADFCKTALQEFEKVEKVEGERATVVDGTKFYWQVPIGMTLKSEFGKILGKKKYQEFFTSRNINTIVKIMEKL